jgi:hypothetical protein
MRQRRGFFIDTFSPVEKTAKKGEIGVRRAVLGHWRPAIHRPCAKDGVASCGSGLLAKAVRELTMGV